MSRIGRRPNGRPGDGPGSRSGSRPDAAEPCPCGLGEPYADCCGRYHRGDAAALTAERLMRSRYSAFAVRDAAYLLRTWHPTTRPDRVDFDPRQQWTGLEILAVADGSPFHSEGMVEFRAHYSERGQADSMHERSRFVRDDGGQWVYLSEVAAPPKLRGEDA